MEAEDRQLRILAFVERYQQQNQDAPTIREIVRATGVSYAEIGGDIDAMVSKGILDYVTEHVTGSEPFSSRQVKAVSASGTGAGSAPAARQPATAPARRPSPPAQRSAGRGGGRAKPRTRSQQPLDPASTAGGHVGAPGRKAFRKRRKPRPAGKAGTNKRAKATTTRAGAPFGAGLALRWRAALIGAIVGTLLFIFAYVEEAGLLTQPIVTLGPLSFSAVIPVTLLLLALQGFLVGRDLEINGAWSRRGLGRVLLLGLFAGTLLMAWSGLQQPPEWFLRTGIPRIVEGIALSLPVLLPFTMSRRNGAALLGLSAALPPTLLSAPPSHISPSIIGVLLGPLLVEVLIARRQDRGRGILITAGALAGIGHTAAAYLTSPGSHPESSWPAVLFVSTATAMAAAWLIHVLRTEVAARRAGQSRSKGGRP